MQLNLTLSNNQIDKIKDDILHRVELDIKAIRKDTLCDVGLAFSTYFGTYTEDATVKIREVFDILNGIIKQFTEDTNEA